MLVKWSIFSDIITLSLVFICYIVMYVSITYFEPDGWQGKKIALVFVFRTFGCYWALWALTLVKIIYGIKWVKKRTRNNFIKYYRLTATQILTMIVYLILNLFLLIWTKQRF